MADTEQRLFDVMIIGGGPAGLTAATYLRRFRRDVVVLDAGQSRARLIPASHNCPGFPSGVGGQALLEKLRLQACQYDVRVIPDEALHISRTGEGFEVATALDTYRSRVVILATGVVDIMPEMPDLEEAIAVGAIRLCPVCDGYEVIGKKLGVLGSDKSAMVEAQALKTYSDNITVLATGPVPPRPAGIPVAAVTGPISLNGNRIVVALESGEQSFDAVYPALGCRVRSDFAISLGADVDETRYLRVDEHLQTSVDGLFAIGDVASAVNQLAVAFGHAAIASTRIHKLLNEKARRQPPTAQTLREPALIS